MSEQCPTCHRPLVYLNPVEYQCQTKACPAVGRVFRLAMLPEHVVTAADFKRFDERIRTKQHAQALQTQSRQRSD